MIEKSRQNSFKSQLRHSPPKGTWATPLASLYSLSQGVQVFAYYLIKQNSQDVCLIVSESFSIDPTDFRRWPSTTLNVRASLTARCCGPPFLEALVSRVTDGWQQPLDSTPLSGWAVKALVCLCVWRCFCVLSQAPEKPWRRSRNKHIKETASGYQELSGVCLPLWHPALNEWGKDSNYLLQCNPQSLNKHLHEISRRDLILDSRYHGKVACTR